MKKYLLVLLLFIAVYSKAQILTEDFEGATFPPTGWITIENCEDDEDIEDIKWKHQEEYSTDYDSYGFAHTGSFSAISSFTDDDAGEGWLITSQFTPTSEHHILHYFLRQAYAEEYFSEFLVKVSTVSQNTMADFTTLVTIAEEDATTTFDEYTVDLSTYINTPIYIAFVHTDDFDDEWYIDDITLEPMEVPGAISDPIPADVATNVEIINAQTSQIDLSWNAPTTGGTVSQYNLWMGMNADDLNMLGHPTETSAHPKTFHFNTTYYWKVEALNRSGQSSESWSFTTQSQPTVTAPYTMGFENAGNIPDGWDQPISNKKSWKYSNDIGESGFHIGNNGDAQGTSTSSGGFFAYVDSNGHDDEDTALLSAYIDISALTNPAFSFYSLSNNEGGSNVTFTVDVWDGTNWNSAVFTSNTNTAGWVKNVVDLSSLTFSGSIQLKFNVNEMSGTFKDDFAIDDIVVDNYSALNINNHPILGLSFSPNPTKDVLKIKAIDSMNSIDIFNYIGQHILHISPNTNNTTINTKQLSKGTYFIKITADNTSSVIKIIKE